MKLSEAIRLGSMIRPQAYGYFLINNKSCALGAALEAVGVPATVSCHQGSLSLLDRWYWLGLQTIKCPYCRFNDAVMGIITHLNDNHACTREAIADWVATIEPADECQVPIGADDVCGLPSDSPIHTTSEMKHDYVSK